MDSNKGNLKKLRIGIIIVGSFIYDMSSIIGKEFIEEDVIVDRFICNNYQYAIKLLNSQWDIIIANGKDISMLRKKALDYGFHQVVLNFKHDSKIDLFIGLNKSDFTGISNTKMTKVIDNVLTNIRNIYQ